MPKRIVDNDTRVALEPNFHDRLSIAHQINTPGFASLTIVRNAQPRWLRRIQHRLHVRPRPLQDENAPDFVWLLDDDIDLPGERSRGSCRPRLRTQRSRSSAHAPSISVTAEPRSRARSTSTPRPALSLPTATRWPRTTTSGDLSPRTSRRPVYSGIRDVDIVSACSLLARWNDVLEVGFWDERFFIYCDDADWCLRFRSKGKRVVCSMDAIVFHTPRTHKLTPSAATTSTATWAG